ncbi:MAG TPA: type I DNA topoisomerase [Anaerolineales bacterium]|nr:type I DNA topoisomerase [Anaerolineales bacterium]
MEAYCVKCKQKRELADPQPVFTKSGTPATAGTCPVCGTRMVRMGRTDAHRDLPKPDVEPRRRSAKGAGKKGRRGGPLVIVESPAKARTVGRFLGKGYRVHASVGHVRDLLKSRLSVDVDNGFAPEYRVPNEKREIVRQLKDEVAQAAEVYLATDPDREGEAIAWHLLEAAEIGEDKARRVVFHEITDQAVKEAFDHPRSIDMKLVDAQQARRILDRLVGYSLSPLLWAKVRSRLSAGRVQSAALRLIVDREREIESFEPREYWTIDAEFQNPDKPPAFRARLQRIDGEAPKLADRASVDPVVADLRQADFTVDTARRGSRIRRPNAPFSTSTMQQEASRRLGFTARKTMAVAQQLYEGFELGGGEAVGLITYMRTDSTQVSAQAQQEARRYIERQHGAAYVPPEPPEYRTRARGAQEAHEAIRPTSVERTPDSVREDLTAEQAKLYRLIWNRFVASQMAAAEYDTLTIEVAGRSPDHAYLFRVSASSLRFAGFLEVYEDLTAENGDADEADLEAGFAQLPAVESGDPVEFREGFPEQHFTQPPPRFSEATLVKALEEYGIGRPSTYAPILTTLQSRGYTHRANKRLEPTEIGMTVNDMIVESFPEIVDLGFTARMEEELDEVAEGVRGWAEVIRDFYGPFSQQVERAMEEMPEVRAEPEILDRLCPESGHPLVVRHGRYGKFIGCSSFPECRYTEPWLERIGVSCPEDGGDLVERRTRRGRMFYGCANYPKCEFTSWKRPLAPPCPDCGGLLTAENRNHAVCLKCGHRFELSSLPVVEGEAA